MRFSKRAEKLEETRQPKRLRNKQTAVDQVMLMMMMEMTMMKKGVRKNKKKLLNIINAHE